MSKKEQLFDDFSPVSLAEWEQKIAKDLKGKSIKELEWNLDNNIELLPNYNKENAKVIEPQHSTSSKENKYSNEWNTSVFILVEGEKEANKKALKALAEGANALTFVGDITQLDVLLKDIMIEIITLDFICAKTSEISQALRLICQKRNLPYSEIKGSISFDYLGNFARKGNWHNSFSDIIKEFNTHLSNSSDCQLNLLTASNYYFQLSGANITQQLGIALAHGVEYFNILNEENTNELLANRLQFHFGIGGNYLAEIAKLRAFRILWSKVLDAFGTSTEKLTINTVTSTLFWSDKQPKNNMLRATSSAMSAVIGGCDSLTIPPFDSVDENKESFSDRIAHNVQLILKEESYFDKVVDPAKGSYFIENLTSELVEKGWAFFQEIEKQGGYINSLESGFIQQEISLSADQLIQQFNSGELSLVGVNKYETDDKKVTLKRIPNDTKSTAITPLSFLHIH
jgi:methylmalonyl-CoA mutase